MSAIIHFDDSPRAALLRGFVKGLAAPVVLFTHHVVPATPGVEPITPPAHPQGDAGKLSHDWAMVGLSVHAAIGHHVQAEASPAARANPKA